MRSDDTPGRGKQRHKEKKQLDVQGTLTGLLLVEGRLLGREWQEMTMRTWKGLYVT